MKEETPTAINKAALAAVADTPQNAQGQHAGKSSTPSLPAAVKEQRKLDIMAAESNCLCTRMKQMPQCHGGVQDLLEGRPWIVNHDVLPDLAAHDVRNPAQGLNGSLQYIYIL